MKEIHNLAKKVKPQVVPSQEEQQQAIKDFAANEVEVVIQTCNEAEYYAVLEKVDRPQIEGIDNCVEYPYSSLTIVVGTFAGKNTAVAWTGQGSYGQKDLEKILTIFKAATILLGLGVCMGIKHEYADVVVSKEIKAACAPKIGEIGTEPRGETKSAGKRVNKVFCHTAGWDTFVCTAGDQGRIAEAHAGLLFSSPNLINNPNIRQSLQQQGYIGAEMEGWVLLEMQEKYPHIESIIIKGISDYGDGKKDGESSTTQVKDKWQLTAAKAAVNYAVSKLTGAHIKIEEV